jgi:hypothetical protein
LLPFNSKTTLRELSFLPPQHAPSDDELRNFALLYQFENLTTLHFFGGCVPTALNQSLLQSPLRLTSFGLYPSKTGAAFTEMFVNLLGSPVLQALQDLHIAAIGRFDIEERRAFEPVIAAITDLPHLASLEVWSFPVHPDWIDSFRKSKCLTSVKWVYRRFTPDDRVERFDACDWEKALASALSRTQGQILNIKFIELDPRHWTSVLPE